jgi:hypothetical protein
MARDYHAIPTTSAPSERVFSIAGNLISRSGHEYQVRACAMSFVYEAGGY